MKKILFISLALLLAACSAVQPAQQEQPTPVVATVLVTVIQPTDVVPPTAIVPSTSIPTEIPSNTPEPTTVPPTPDTSSSVSSSDLTPVLVDNILGKGIFTDISFSSDRITLNCYPREIEISMKAGMPEVTRAEMYYRMLEAPSFFRYSDWYLVGNLDTDGNGNFFKTFEATDITPDWRVLEEGRVEFQFVGYNKGAGKVGNTQKIERMVSYFKECPQQ